jgi:hypothetical protein
MARGAAFDHSKDSKCFAPHEASSRAAPGLDERARVIDLLSASSVAPSGRGRRHLDARVPLGDARGLRRLGIDDQAMPVINDGVPGVPQFGFAAWPLASQNRLGIGRRGVRRIAPPLAVAVGLPGSRCGAAGGVSVRLKLLRPPRLRHSY